MSLLYECIHTVIAGGMLATTGSGSNAESANNLAATCVTKLRTFLEDADQNCKLTGVVGIMGGYAPVSSCNVLTRHQLDFF